MKTWLRLVSVAVSVVVTACGSTPRVATFDVPADSVTLVDEVQQAMIADGFDIGEINERVGFVRTEWTNVPVDNFTDATHRRYTVLLKQRGGATRITVRGEFQRCEMSAPAGTVTTQETCTRVDWNTRTCISQETHPEVVCRSLSAIMADDQQDLDAFAAKVRESLGGAPVDDAANAPR